MNAVIACENIRNKKMIKPLKGIPSYDERLLHSHHTDIQ